MTHTVTVMAAVKVTNTVDLPVVFLQPTGLAVAITTGAMAAGDLC